MDARCRSVVLCLAMACVMVSCLLPTASAASPPEARIVATHDEANKYVLIGFSAGSSTDPDDGVGNLTFSWKFGDGAEAVGVNASHAYVKSGTFDVTLTVKDNEGLTDNDTMQVTILNKPPAADFVMPANATVDELVAFNASKSRDFDGYIVNYTWDFGDQSSAKGLSVSHNFTSAGNYTVMLIVTDDSGTSVVMKRTIWIKPKAVAPEPPTDDGPGLGPMYIGIGAIVVVVVLVCIAAYVHSAKGKAR